VKNHKSKTYERGVLAEGAAELYLRAKGFEILERRYKSPVGEIDLIALDDSYLVFVEVKARGSIDDALSCITPKMRSRIYDAAGHYMAANPGHAARSMRVDVVAIMPPFRIKHLENAFME
jgi:putative endonuclease